jgi:hypothetical protein
MLKHLDYLMISNGGCDPFHYMKGRGGLGYKPSPPFMHGLGYDYNLMDGGGYKVDKSHLIKGRGRWEEEEVPVKDMYDDDGEPIYETIKTWIPYDIEELNKMGSNELKNNYWFNEEQAPDIDENVEEQMRIYNVISSKNWENKQGMSDILKHQREVNEKYIEGKDTPTEDSKDSEETKKVIKLLNEADILRKEKYKIPTYEDEPYFIINETSSKTKDAKDFEKLIAGIDDNDLFTQKGRTTKGYKAEFYDLDDKKMHYVKEAISSIDPLKERIEDLEKRGYKILVRAYTTNYDVFDEEGNPIFAADSWFKVDTFVDIKAKKKINDKGKKFIEQIDDIPGIIIEDKYYSGDSYNKKAGLEKFQYSFQATANTEKKAISAFRKEQIKELRESKEKYIKSDKYILEMKDVQKELKEDINRLKNKDPEKYGKKILKYSQEYNENHEKIKLLKNKKNEYLQERNEVKENLKKTDSLIKQIKDSIPSYSGLKLDTSKVPISQEIINYKPKKGEKENKTITMLQAKAKSGGRYELDDNHLTSAIYDKDGNVKSKRRVVGGEEFTTDNYNNFANRYVTDAVGSLDKKLSFGWIKDNMTLDNIPKKLTKSAYSDPRNTSITLSPSERVISKNTLDTKIKEDKVDIEKKAKMLRKEFKDLGFKFKKK